MDKSITQTTYFIMMPLTDIYIFFFVFFLLIILYAQKQWIHNNYYVANASVHPR